MVTSRGQKPTNTARIQNLGNKSNATEDFKWGHKLQRTWCLCRGGGAVITDFLHNFFAKRPFCVPSIVCYK